MTKILVTGANGMLGQDLCPILEDRELVDEIIETDIHNLDITNEIQVNKFLRETKPEFVIHCAAYTKVDNAESEKELVEKINVKGTEIIAKACKSIGATLIFISTDYVFDGKKQSKYMPEDAPNPLNTYGKTKFEAEKIIQKVCDKFYIARTSWLYGHHGKNFVETMLNLANENTEIKVVNDQIGIPTWTVDLSEGICDLIEEEPDYGIYHICSSGKTTWFEFAKEIFKLSGIKANLSSCTTEEYGAKAIRPKYSAMENAKIIDNWKKSLKSYLDLRIEE